MIVKSGRMGRFCARAVAFLLINMLIVGAAGRINEHGMGAEAVETLSKYGSRGEEVRQIQTKLKNLGFYTGAVDGIFGTQTKNAVIAFQKSKGLTQDGIAGPKTLGALGVTSSTGGGSRDNNLELLAKIISAEARGEPYIGQVAVGAVVLNRVKHPSFPNTISGVIYQKNAFEPVSNGSINRTPIDSAYRAAEEAMNGADPTGGAIYFYNPKTATSKWIRSRVIVKTIGTHVFCVDP